MAVQGSLAWERIQLEKEDARGERRRYFFAYGAGGEARIFTAYLVCPYTGIYGSGVYRFKLVKIHVWLPDGFPRVRPEVTFIQHRTRHHVHPNFHATGKISLSFLE
jgi:ubiquitin-protein ligase